MRAVCDGLIVDVDIERCVASVSIECKVYIMCFADVNGEFVGPQPQAERRELSVNH